MPSLVYRGVPKNTLRWKQAIAGNVVPRGTSKNYEAHVRGEDVDCDVTSWSKNPSVAKKFDDIILVLDCDEEQIANRIVPHPKPILNPHEEEVLIRGALTGVQRYVP